MRDFVERVVNESVPAREGLGFSLRVFPRSIGGWWLIVNGRYYDFSEYREAVAAGARVAERVAAL